MVTNYKEILNKLDNLSPIEYAKNRNFVDGSVSMLSPYISRGVISTRQVLEHLINQGFEGNKIEKFIQELAWRDYWQLIWIEKDINFNIKNKQTDVNQNEISKSIIKAKTGIEAIDKAILDLYKTGYMHNHLRMYVASISTNIAKNHWKSPAKWMYYHLLDGDWASNALSWQWVCGANSNKKYIANQENINKYTYSKQKNTFLDCSYEDIMKIEQPSHFKSISEEILYTELPKSDKISIDNSKPICVYNYYNLDPVWRTDIAANRILLIEPSVFKKYPIAEKAMNFMISLSKNISSIKVFVGEFDELIKKDSIVYFKEHPLNYNYKGNEDSRDWISSVKGYYPSFFGFWNKVKKEISF
ncbi:deoxyribodipyrimidine photolyase [Flavobacteriaceae bacterium]|nr:deoxyribodipyrimidine photolyase [Flavobacteriaceae bacterium]MDB9712984.1 deoxyribodipyrimidine photolyase [Flavobacteriaceae bacterium]MDC1493010.1 deoxyribodipyrimidine photolyase [Flavobacteriaceae bacterium]